jgi:hypothetical protein
VRAQNVTLFAKSRSATPSAPTHPQNVKVYVKNHFVTGNATAQQTAKNRAAPLFAKNPHIANLKHKGV